jgi:hypothetical protein
VGLLIGGGLIGMKFWNKSSGSGDVKQEITKLLARHLAPQGNTEAEVKELVDQHHDACFDQASSMGGRRQSSSFDAEK